MAPVKRPALRRALAAQLPSLGVFLAVLVLWQFVVSALRVREYILPSPLAVLRALSFSDIPWLAHLWITTLEIVGAFLLAGAVGGALGVTIARAAVLGRARVPLPR